MESLGLQQVLLPPEGEPGFLSPFFHCGSHVLFNQVDTDSGGQPGWEFPLPPPPHPQAAGPWSRHSPSRGCFLIYKVVLLAAPLSEGWYDCWGHPIRWTAGGGVSAWREYCGGVGCTAVESQKLRPDIMCSLDIWNHKGFSCPNHKFPSTRLLQPNSPLYPGDQVQYLPIPKEQVSVPWTQTPAMDLF